MESNADCWYAASAALSLLTLSFAVADPNSVAAASTAAYKTHTLYYIYYHYSVQTLSCICHVKSSLRTKFKTSV